MRTMLLVWREQKETIASALPEEMRAFNDKLRREWAVETGLIERLYTFDRGITETLIEHGINADLIPHGKIGVVSAEEAVAMMRDHENVLDALFDFVRDKRGITTSYIKQLHAALVQNQNTATGVDQFGNKSDVPLIKGDYKKHPNNPTRTNGKVHEYCPPEHVASEMDNLIKMHGGHTAKNIAPEVSAAWLHHRFVQIHPFQDGNGRVARSLASLVFIRAGGFPLTIRDVNGERAKYINALEAANDGDLQPLISVFATSQRREFARAINISREILGDTTQDTEESRRERTEKIIKSAARKLAGQRKQNQEWNQARHIAAEMQILAMEILEQTTHALDKNIADYGRESGFSAICYIDPDSIPLAGRSNTFFDFSYDVDKIAEQFGYAASTGIYDEWAHLKISLNNEDSYILVSFHGVGKEYRGVIACLAFFFCHKKGKNASSSRPQPPLPLTDEEFQINYQDSAEEVKTRFRPWLEKAMERGLALWHESL